MKKIIFILFTMASITYAQNDSVYVFVDYQGQEYEYFFPSQEIADQYLSETFDTTHGSYVDERILLIDYAEKISDRFEGHMIRAKGKNRNKVWIIKSEYGKKLRKEKKEKKEESQ